MKPLKKAMAKNLKGVGDLKLKTGQEKDKAQSTCKKSVHLHKIMSQEVGFVLLFSTDGQLTKLLRKFI